MRNRLFIATSAILLGLAPQLLAQPGGRGGGRGGAQVQLPEGPGRELIQAQCTVCHGTFQINGSAGYDAEGWKDLISTMVKLPEAQANLAGDYLAENFPPKPGRAPKLIPGDTDITITEWLVPTLGQRARDPIEAPDGTIWWTGMWASLAGHLDPRTGRMEEYLLPKDARPHSIIPDAEGNIWYSGNSNATIGKLDPKTGIVTQYKTKARDPHTMAFHPNGKLYFTAQQSSMLGRLDPATGEITEVDTEMRPYGIKVSRNGTIWVAYNGTNKIGALNPDTMEVRYYEIPNERSRIRRLGFDSKGMIWYGNSIGKIGMLNPETSEVKEWDSPSGARSSPYGLAVIDDKVWYNESGMRPDALVRFDPATETFQSWAIPSGYGIVRNMWVTHNGNLLIHQSSSNRVGLVEIPK